jgi:hypothetical protein
VKRLPHRGRAPLDRPATATVATARGVTAPKRDVVQRLPLLVAVAIATGAQAGEPDGGTIDFGGLAAPRKQPPTPLPTLPTSAVHRLPANPGSPMNEGWAIVGLDDGWLVATRDALLRLNPRAEVVARAPQRLPQPSEVVQVGDRVRWASNRLIGGPLSVRLDTLAADPAPTPDAFLLTPLSFFDAPPPVTEPVALSPDGAAFARGVTFAELHRVDQPPQPFDLGPWLDPRRAGEPPTPPTPAVAARREGWRAGPTGPQGAGDALEGAGEDPARVATAADRALLQEAGLLGAPGGISPGQADRDADPESFLGLLGLMTVDPALLSMGGLGPNAVDSLGGLPGASIGGGPGEAPRTYSSHALEAVELAGDTLVARFQVQLRRGSALELDSLTALIRVDTWDLRLLEGAPASGPLVVSDDGSLLVTADGYAGLHLWDAHTGARLSTLPGPRGGSDALALAPDARWLAAAGRAGLAVYAADPHGWVEIAHVDTAQQGISHLAIRGDALAALGRDGSVVVVDLPAIAPPR